MAKKRKTRKQKIASGLRQTKEIRVHEIEQQLPEDIDARSTLKYTYSPSLPKESQSQLRSNSSRIQIVDTKFLTRDLRKIVFVTVGLVALELVLYTFVRVS